MAFQRIFLLCLLLIGSLTNARDLRSLEDEQAPLEPQEETEFAQTLELLKEEPQADLQQTEDIQPAEQLEKIIFAQQETLVDPLPEQPAPTYEVLVDPIPEQPAPIYEVLVDPIPEQPEVLVDPVAVKSLPTFEVLVDPVPEQPAPTYEVYVPVIQSDDSELIPSEPLEEQPLVFREEVIHADESEEFVPEELLTEQFEELPLEQIEDQALLSAETEEEILPAEEQPVEDLARNEDLPSETVDIEQSVEVESEPETLERAEEVQEQVGLENEALPAKSAPLWYFGPVQKDPPSGRLILPPILQFDLPDLGDLIGNNPLNTFVVAKLQALQASIANLLAALNEKK